MNGKYTESEVKAVLEELTSKPISLDRNKYQSADLIVQSVIDYIYRTLNSDIDSVYYLLKLLANAQVVRCSETLSRLEELLRVYGTTQLEVTSPDSAKLAEVQSRINALMAEDRSLATDSELKQLQTLLLEYTRSSKTTAGRVHTGLSPEDARARTKSNSRSIQKLLVKLAAGSRKFINSLDAYMFSDFESNSSKYQAKLANSAISASDGEDFSTSKDAALRSAVALALLKSANNPKLDIREPKYEGPVETLPGDPAKIRGGTVPFILQDEESVTVRVDGDDSKLIKLTAPPSEEPTKKESFEKKDFVRSESATFFTVDIKWWAVFGATSFDPDLVYGPMGCHAIKLPWLKTVGIEFDIRGNMARRTAEFDTCGQPPSWPWVLSNCTFDDDLWYRELKQAMENQTPFHLHGDSGGKVFNVDTGIQCGVWTPRTGMVFIYPGWGYYTMLSPNPNGGTPTGGNPAYGGNVIPCADWWWVSPYGSATIEYSYHVVGHGLSFNTPKGHNSVVPILDKDYRDAQVVDHNAHLIRTTNDEPAPTGSPYWFGALASAFNITDTLDLAKALEEAFDPDKLSFAAEASNSGPSGWNDKLSWKGFKAKRGSAYRLTYPNSNDIAEINPDPFQPKFINTGNSKGPYTINDVLELTQERRGEAHGKDTDYSTVIVTPPNANDWVNISVDTQLPISYSEDHKFTTETPEGLHSEVAFVGSGEIHLHGDDVGVSENYICHTKVSALAVDGDGFKTNPPIAHPVDNLPKATNPDMISDFYRHNITRNQVVIESLNEEADSSLEVVSAGLGFSGNSTGLSNTISLGLTVSLTDVVTRPGYNIKPEDVVLEKSLIAIRPIGIVKSIEGTVVKIQLLPENIPHDYPFKNLIIVAQGWQKYDDVRESVQRGIDRIEEALEGDSITVLASTYVNSGSGASSYISMLHSLREVVGELRKAYLNYDAHVVNTVSMLLEYLKQEKMTLPYEHLTNANFDGIARLTPRELSQETNIERALEEIVTELGGNRGVSFEVTTPGEGINEYNASGSFNGFGNDVNDE
jgi:hypothetical protein